MKKVLLSAALLLATSAATVIASMAPENAKTDATAISATAMPAAAAPVAAGGHPHKGSHHGMAHMSKEEIVAKLKSKGEEVEKLGASLSGLEKDLFASAIARFNKWIEVIGKFSEPDTNPSISAKRAKHELRLAKTIAHHNAGYPAEKVAKWKADFEGFKADVAKLTGDTKTAAEAQVANIESVFADAEKAKDTSLLHSFLNTIKYEVDALRGLLHHAEHKAADASVTGAAKPAEPAKAQ